MAWYPRAVRKNIPPGPSDPPINPRIAILHVDAGNAFSLFRWFSGPSGGIESHFFVKKSGRVQQYRSTRYQADANKGANDIALSIETQGFGWGRWNKRQLSAIKDLLIWLEHSENIPLCKVTGPRGHGVGYHVQFGAPGAWTGVSKSCPGPRRIRQYNTILVPWMRGGAEEVDDVSEKDVINALNSRAGKKALRQAVWNARFKAPGARGKRFAWVFLSQAWNRSGDARDLSQHMPERVLHTDGLIHNPLGGDNEYVTLETILRWILNQSQEDQTVYSDEQIRLVREIARKVGVLPEDSP